MCLLVKSFDEELKFKIADKDIVCYKIVYNNLSKSYPKFWTPIQGCDIPMECIQGTIPFEAQGDEDITIHHCEWEGTLHRFELNGGFIHTYMDTYDVSDDIRDIKHELWKCVIPKGTKYTTGIYGHVPSYASKSIKFIEKVHTPVKTICVYW